MSTIAIKDNTTENIDLTLTQKILDDTPYKGNRALIGVLQKIQGVYGFLPERSMEMVSSNLHVPMAKIYGVATFYSQFRLTPLGKYTIMVCDGTACHVRSSNDLIEELRSHLEINPGETTEDGLFSIEIVNCIGACSLAPAIVINNEDTHAKMTPKRLAQLVEDYKKKG